MCFSTCFKFTMPLNSFRFLNSCLKCTANVSREYIYIYIYIYGIQNNNKKTKTNSQHFDHRHFQEIMYFSYFFVNLNLNFVNFVKVYM